MEKRLTKIDDQLHTYSPIKISNISDIISNYGILEDLMEKKGFDCIEDLLVHMDKIL